MFKDPKIYAPFNPQSLDAELEEALRKFKDLKKNEDYGWQIPYTNLFDYLKQNYLDYEYQEEFRDWLDDFIKNNSEHSPESIIEEYLSFI